jgi:hypothetical protein
MKVCACVYERDDELFTEQAMIKNKKRELTTYIYGNGMSESEVKFQKKTIT